MVKDVVGISSKAKIFQMFPIRLKDVEAEIPGLGP